MNFGVFVLATIRMALCAVVALAFADATFNVVPRRIEHRRPRRPLVGRRVRALAINRRRLEDDLSLAG